MTNRMVLSEKHPDKSFFGIFDGHGGARASEFVAEHLANRCGELDDPHDHAQLEGVARALDAAFKAITPGRQGEYKEYIGTAKREDTRARRLAKIVPMILAGTGLNDAYKK